MEFNLAIFSCTANHQIKTPAKFSRYTVSHVPDLLVQDGVIDLNPSSKVPRQVNHGNNTANPCVHMGVGRCCVCVGTHCVCVCNGYVCSVEDAKVK